MITIIDNFDGFGDEPKETLEELNKISEEQLRQFKTETKAGFDPNQPRQADGIVERMLKALDLNEDFEDITIKANFNPQQARDKDGKWADKWAGMKTREQEIKDQEYETALLYDDKGNLLEEIDGTESHVEINRPPSSLRVLTHNHPNNSSFSRADILFLTNLQLDSIRAVGPNGEVYEMKTKGSWAMFGFKLHGADQPYNWRNTAVMSAWEKAKKLADSEVKSYLIETLGDNWESPYWKENENKVKTAQKIFGKWSDRVNWHLANNTELGKNMFEYKIHKP